MGCYGFALVLLLTDYVVRKATGLQRATYTQGCGMGRYEMGRYEMGRDERGGDERGRDEEDKRPAYIYR